MESYRHVRQKAKRADVGVLSAKPTFEGCDTKVECAESVPAQVLHEYW